MDSSPIEPVKSRHGGTRTEQSQTARATLALREMLVQGKLRPGERLREVPLAEELRVSRVPLRLALERLAHEGFLEVRPTRGFVVQQFDVADIHEAIDLRGAIEGMAARLAAERVRDGGALDLLRGFHQQMSALVRRKHLTLDAVSVYIDSNFRFHQELVRLSGSRRIRHAMDQICSLPFASPNAFVHARHAVPESHELFLISVEHHRSLVEAIAGGESARAESLAREHARVARRNLEMALADGAMGETVPGLKLIRR